MKCYPAYISKSNIQPCPASAPDEDCGMIQTCFALGIFQLQSSILQINTDDLAAVQAFLNAKGTTHTVLG
jgi:hypothetical protein